MFFYLKKLFLTSTHQNDLRIYIYKIHFKQKKNFNLKKCRLHCVQTHL